MSTTYGRNFSFRIPPRAERRAGRYSVPATGTQIPIGAPIQATDEAEADALGMQPVTLVTSAGAPVIGMSGLAVYEYGPAAFAGDDALLTTYSDKGDVPLGAAVQMISGTEVKVVFKNTVDNDFLDVRAYAGRTFVAGMGATPTVAVGDLLTPGPGNTNDGFWQVTATPANAWLVVVSIDTTRLEVEARFVF